jgi:hypothetical protein
VSRSSNFVKHEVPIREKEIKTVGSWGLWTVDLAIKTCKFGFHKDDQANFGRRKVTKHEIMRRSKDWPTVIAKGHIGEEE